MKITLSKSFLTVDGKRAGVRIDAGPWVAGVNPATIKVRCKRGTFPAAFRQALQVENNSDMSADYFEADCLRLLPGHPLYDQARALA